ncbi:PTS system IIA component, L-Asc family [Clostridium cavendishii DSM 21758]|uniref:Ascorbate-specific PTS system EIIA component n=1 Tax=Clostridium cavendishii DSM 21758 TaxID=1121302 RepID=A0A1M6GZL4_9CLOT|nr:PTS sugar transporter subunit IIA [Clostridium cavendishii]SHJ15360.1 PTS system IIA component, L-Asc family [Clostridium cavendishii DSM 21758]
MLKELIEKKRYSFHEGFDNWEEAVHAACMPLIEQNAVDKLYVDEIIASIKKHGPYIVIAPNICIPHAQEGKGVNETAICFMKTERPVHFSDDPEHDAQLFFVLASTNNELHMQNLVNMVGFIENEEKVEKLLKAKQVEDLMALL